MAKNDLFFPNGTCKDVSRLIDLLKEFSQKEIEIKNQRPKMADIRESYYYRRSD